MLNRFAASVSALALLAGFAAAPHSHLHVPERDATSGSDHVHTVLHSHVSSHARDPGHEHAPANADPRDTDGLSLDAFVFQPVKNHALTNTAVVLPEAVPPPVSARVWASVAPTTSPHYGSPPIFPAASRAPPTLPSRSA